MKTYPLPYLYQSPYYQERGIPKYAVITLPEIFGLNANAEIVADRFCEIFSLPSYGLDFFYALTHEHNDFGYESEAVKKGVGLMNNMTDSLFFEMLSKAKEHITKEYPSVEQFVVCGFCFGGRLAILAGADMEVSHVISFYGSRSNVALPGSALSPVEQVAKRGDTPLPYVMTLFGQHDESITDEDRADISDTLEKAGIDFTESLYDAGHAFFNSHRKTYMAEAARESWNDLKVWLRERL